jgi:hypothetical protein
MACPPHSSRLNFSEFRRPLKSVGKRLALPRTVHVVRPSLWSEAKRIVIDWFAPIFLAAALPCTATASVSANLTWTASADPTVTGYNIYYGGTSGQYTNSLSVAAITNAVVPELAEGVTYFFAAKAHNASGSESPFSNEAIFCGLTVAPNTAIAQAVFSTNESGDSLTFSLGTNAPAGASIDATNGVFNWVPGLDYASTTNAITVTITDNTSTNLSTSATLLVVVTDYLQVGLVSTAVQLNQTGVLPITLAASDDPSNVQITLDWPSSQLGTPTLTFNAPATAGSVQVQNSTVVVSLQIAANQPFTNSATIAQLSFRPPAGQPSAFVPVVATSISGAKSDGTAYSNTAATPGQVVIVGASPLLQLQSPSGQARLLTVFGQPGSNYEVQSTTNLIPPVMWTTLASHWQTDVANSMDVDASQPVIFYRLQQD